MATNSCLPDFAVAAIREALPAFDRQIKGFALHDAMLTGVETRHFASPLGFESSISVGWHDQRSEGGGCGMHIRSPAFERNRQCAAFLVIRKRV